MNTMVLAPDEIMLDVDDIVDIDCRIAASRKDREAAFRLVYNSYLQLGLGTMNQHEMRVMPYHLLPTTQIFVAKMRGELISTMSLVIDGAMGLPMESVYGDEVSLLRERGLLLGEVSCLADRRRGFQGFLPVFLHLCQLMVQYARHECLDALVVVVHPKHARFYRRFMDFHVLGEERTYPTVRNRPAVALWLDFARIDKECPANYDAFFGEQLPYEQLQAQPISPADCDYFRPMIDPSFVYEPSGEEEPACSMAGGRSDAAVV
jgi:hypothetical protein